MNIALVLAGGAGIRLGSDIPKQYIKVDGKMIIEYCLQTLFAHPDIDAVRIVMDGAWREKTEQAVHAICGTLGTDVSDKWHGVSMPGSTRQLSIVNGLRDIRDSAVCSMAAKVNVLIHDAARPLLSSALISRCFDALSGHDGVMPVLPMKDTVYMSDDGKTVNALLDRNKIFCGQAPELYDFDAYLRACERLMPEQILHINGSTEPAVMAGLDVVMIQGDENNYKITTEADLSKFRQYTAAAAG